VCEITALVSLSTFLGMHQGPGHAWRGAEVGSNGRGLLTTSWSGRDAPTLVSNTGSLRPAVEWRGV
jgi:hypothetical protein